jgi:octaprenyl-diphosphate synthase
MSILESSLDLRSLIDQFFSQSFSTDNALITEAIRRMLAGGGKRLRPRLTLMAAQAVGSDVHQHIPIAAYIELIHVATLIHDDVVDGAQQRRGVNATAIDFGNQISVLAGDYLFAWIFKSVTASYPAPIPHILSATLASICDGEVLQLRSLSNTALTREAYREIVEKKTASLFVAATECGAILGGGDETVIKALSNYGRLVGTAFQIVDDILDLTSTEAELGKPVGHDFIEGKVTLPLILALENVDAADHAAVQRFYAGDRQDPQPVLAILAHADGIGRARSFVDQLINEAITTLDVLPHERSAALIALAETLRAH